MAKPKRTSITVTVRNGDSFRATRPGKTYLGLGVALSDIKRNHLAVPSIPYRLTYFLDPNGKYKVVCSVYEDSYPRIKLRRIELDVCFLPKAWAGLRVSRKVEAIYGP